ncbi:MAG: DUF5668 domain-containing protein [Actinomycetota bacterium]
MEHGTDHSVEHTPAPATGPVSGPPAPAGQPYQAPSPKGPGPALWGGVALVVLGVLLLVSQLMPEMHLWRWWPLIVVGVGIRQMFGPRRGPWSVRHLGEGLGTVAIGLVLLGQMLGVLRWDVWLNIIRLWPVLLVSLGLEIIGKATRAEWIRFAGSLVVVAALAYGALVLTPGGGWPPLTPVAGGEPFDYVERHDDRVITGEAEITGAVGQLDVRAGDDLAAAEGRSPYGVTFDVVTYGRSADVTVADAGGPWGPATPGSDIEVTLDRDIAWDLVIKAGVSAYDIDLRELTVSSLELESGVSAGTVTFGRPDDDARRVDIEAGVSGIVLRFPRDEGVRVTVSEGLSGVESGADWTKSREGGSRVYESERFSSDSAYWDVYIESGIGGITLQYY